MNSAYRINDKPIVECSPRKVTRALYPTRAIPFAFLLSVSLGAVALTTDTGCAATNGQISDTIIAGEQLAACILGEVLGGVTDPLAIAARCAGALPAVIADVIADFETKQTQAQLDIADAAPSPDASTSTTTLLAMARKPISDRERVLLDEAKQKAVAMVAASQKK